MRNDNESVSKDGVETGGLSKFDEFGFKIDNTFRDNLPDDMKDSYDRFMGLCLKRR